MRHAFYIAPNLVQVPVNRPAPKLLYATVAGEIALLLSVTPSTLAEVTAYFSATKVNGKSGLHICTRMAEAGLPTESYVSAERQNARILCTDS